MQEPFYIKKIAVLGAGVMGAQIAAHCTNAGFKTLLFDLPPRDGDKNNIVNKAINNLKKIKPSPLGAAGVLNQITACNYDDDIEKLEKCDLIIEAIGENMDWKTALYQRIFPHLNKHSIIVSNTSGLSINQLSKILPENLRSRFCGLHFFNPPRYMHLVELIPAEDTSEKLLNALESWLTSNLGKGVVRAKDTPNFIANRIGVFSLLVIMHRAKLHGLGFDEVDALTGSLLGRPKSATFRTMDVVGLDTMMHVVNTMQEQLRDDPWYELFTMPSWFVDLVQNGFLGQKTGQGIYRKNGKLIEVLDVNTADYRPANGEVSDSVKKIMALHDPAKRMIALRESDDRQAKFLSECLLDLFHYGAYHVKQIASNVRDIDLAMRWGFGWNEGPFETWELSGVKSTKLWIDESIDTGKTIAKVELPSWIKSVDSFYVYDGAYSPITNKYQGQSKLAVYQKQFFPDKLVNQDVYKKNIIFENEGVCLWHLCDDVAVVGFKSKANTIGRAVIDGLHQSIDIATNLTQGLIIHQSSPENFSLGADLHSVIKLVDENKLHVVESMISDFQKLALQIKYSQIPIIAGLRGRALGGGCELMMHCDKIVASFESYPGLVELGVGVIPAGGGCKEFSIRAADNAAGMDILPFVQPYFEMIAKATVSSSALDAKQLGYLKDNDIQLMHRNEILFAALSNIKAMNASNYIAPLKKLFPVAGIEGRARLQAGLVNWLEGGFISNHDYLIAKHLANVICGGDVNAGTSVDEEWILKLEKDAFMTLLQTPESQARIRHMLSTGRPLRN